MLVKRICTLLRRYFRPHPPRQRSRWTVPRLEFLESRLAPSAAPYVQFINRTSPASAATAASSVTFTVAFSEIVTGVDATDFAVAMTGTVTATVPVVVSGNGGIYTVTVNGIAGNGTLGLNLVDNGSIRDLGGDELVASNGAAAFDSQTTIATGTRPYSVVAADVNGDGNPDLIVADSLDNNVDVLLGNGDGAFQAGKTFGTGAGPQSVAVADLAGDGKLDIIVANRDAGTVSVLLGNGDGTFQAQQTYAAGPDPFFVTTADLAGDGTQDIIIANYGSNTVSVLLGNGDGTFQAQQTVTVGTHPTSVAAAELTGDGIPDLVVANQRSNTVSVLLGNGDGTFQSQQTFATGTYPSSVAVSDLNGDGKPDIVVANYGSRSVGVLLGNGDGTFQPMQTFAAGTRPFAVATADVNGDGKPDIVAANYRGNNVSLLLGNGDGTFQPQQTLATGALPIAVTLADVNGDGKPDLIAVNLADNTLGLLRNAENGNFTGQVYTIEQGPPTVVSFVAANGNETDAQSVSWTLTFSQPVTGVSASDFSTTLTGTASASAPVITQVTDSIYTVQMDNITGLGALDVSLLDNGAIRDLAGNPLSTAGNTFLPENTFAVGSGAYSVAVADLNGDGIPDLVVANRNSYSVSVLLGNGDGTFQPQQTYAVGSAPHSVAVADLAGNGKEDIVVANEFNDTVGVLMGNGDGTFQPMQTYATGSHPLLVAVADLTGDGKLDLVIADHEGATVSVLMGNGDGTFQSQQTYAVGNEPRALAVADVNGDGIPDILTANYTDNTVSVLLGNGDGTFQPQQTLATGTEPRSIAVADLNGDGKPDIVVANNGSNNVGVFLGNGDGTFQPQQTFAAEPNPFSVSVADLNGDGIPDLLVANISGYAVSTLLGNGDGTFQAPTSFPAASEPRFVAVADLNGDGRPDLIAANYLSDNVSVLLGASVLTAPSITRVAPVPTVSVTSGDGQSAAVDSAFADPLVVTVTDQFGNPMSGVAVAFSAPASGPGATLGTPTLSDLTGQVIDTAFANTHAGSYQVTASVGGSDAVFNLDNTPGFAVGLVLSGFPAQTAAGNASGFTVEAVDSFGNIDPTFQAILGFSSNDPLTELPGPSLLTNGVGTFVATFLSSGDKTLTVTDLNAPSFTATETGIDVIALVNVQGAVFIPIVGQTFTATVATFTPASLPPFFFPPFSPFSPFRPPFFSNEPDSFAASINWGDGSITSGTIIDNPDGTFDVVGTHAYTTLTTFLVQTTVIDQVFGTVERTAPTAAVVLSDGEDVQLQSFGFARSDGSGVLTTASDTANAELVQVNGGATNATLFVADYADNPTPAPSPGQVFFDVRATGVTAADTLVVSFGYGDLNPDGVTLEVFDPRRQQFVPVVGSQNVPNGLVNDKANHVITVLFDGSSAPPITDLDGTVFTITVASAPILIPTSIAAPLAQAPAPLSPPVTDQVQAQIVGQFQAQAVVQTEDQALSVALSQQGSNSRSSFQASSTVSDVFPAGTRPVVFQDSGSDYLGVQSTQDSARVRTSVMMHDELRDAGAATAAFLAGLLKDGAEVMREWTRLLGLGDPMDLLRPRTSAPMPATPQRGAEDEEAEALSDIDFVFSTGLAGFDPPPLYWDGFDLGRSAIVEAPHEDAVWLMAVPLVGAAACRRSIAEIVREKRRKRRVPC